LKIQSKEMVPFLVPILNKSNYWQLEHQDEDSP